MDEIFLPGNRRRLTLKRGKDRVIANRHPWIFAGAVAAEAGPADAAIADLYDPSGVRVASGFYSARSEIRLRALTFGDEELTGELIGKRLAAAIERRRPLLTRETNAVRVVNAEGDELSGLVIDLYNDVAVAEVANAGLERIKATVVDIVRRELRPRLTYFKNDLPALNDITPHDKRYDRLREYTLITHSRNPEIVNAIHRGDAFLTQLDGEWWINP